MTPSYPEGVAASSDLYGIPHAPGVLITRHHGMEGTEANAWHKFIETVNTISPPR
jgi:hypothetical protein